MTKKKNIVVIGGAVSGPAAAARARELNEDARIILVERNKRVSYAQAGLAYYLSGEVSAMGELDRERAGFFKAVYDIDVLTRTSVQRIDASGKKIVVKRGKELSEISYDDLIYAVGAESILPVNAPVDAKNLVRFRTLDDLEEISAVLRRNSRKVTIIGGGPFGIEAADGLIRRGCKVTIIEKNRRILAGFSLEFSGAAEQALGSECNIIKNAEVRKYELRGNRITALRLSNGRSIKTDIVIVAIGLRPRTQLLADAGIKLEKDGTVLINDSARTSNPHIYACGVCVSLPHVIAGRPVWLPQGALADKTAQVAGANAAGGNERISRALGSALIRVNEITVGRTGLSFNEAADYFGAKNVGSATVSAPSHEKYIKVSRPVMLRMIWHKKSGKVLGAEAAGETGVDKRIDTAAAGILGGITVKDLAVLDFGYTPALSAARDPLNVAATVAVLEMGGIGESIAPSQLFGRIAKYRVIDVEPASLRIKGSLEIPLVKLRKRLSEIKPGKRIAIVSQDGRRGWQAARILSQKGYSRVVYLAGGIGAWKLCGLPLERK